jgi:hypothetical protein
LKPPNDNDEIPINTNNKDKRPLRSKPNIEATRHDISVDISVLKQLKLFKKMKKKLFKKLIYSIY